jgi:hypothetical protein
MRHRVDLDALVDAGERAVRVRGTVMLSLRDDGRRWCAICVAVDGSIELRVAEPSRGWRRQRPAAGEAWLRDHGFVHVVDAWAAPAPRGTGMRGCADVLSCALRNGLGAPEDGELVEVLMHSGVSGDAQPPAPTAPHAEHIRYALSALVARRRGKVSIEGGRPAATWAWVFAADGTMELSPEPVDDPTDYDRDWSVSLQGLDLGAEADGLTTMLHDDLGRDPSDPLFVSFMDL